jgi:hypothetical protein
MGKINSELSKKIDPNPTYKSFKKYPLNKLPNIKHNKGQLNNLSPSCNFGRFNLN